MTKSPSRIGSSKPKRKKQTAPANAAALNQATTDEFEQEGMGVAPKE